MFAQPQVVATLGKSSTSTRHAGASFTLSSLGKRKRTELVLATDSSGVEIFDAKARNARSVTSFAVPPGENFLCPPVSVVIKQKGSRSQRLTYWATRDYQQKSSIGRKLNKIKLTCLRENGADSETTTATLGTAQDPVSVIKSLEIIPSISSTKKQGPHTHSVVAIHSNRLVTAFSSDLQTIEYQTRLPNTSAGATVEYTATVSLEEARQSLLSTREDVAATLPADSGVILVCVLKEGLQGTSVSYLHLNNQPSSLFSMPIPDSRGPIKSQFSLHTKSSRLYELRQDQLESCFYVYDLSGYGARLETVMQIPGAKSFARISQHTIAFELEKHVAVHDVKWKFLQGNAPEHSEATEAAVKLLSFYPGTALVLAGSKLLSYNLRDETNTDHRDQKRRRTGGLAAAVGRGAPSEDLPSKSPGHGDTKSLGKRLMPSASLAASIEISKRFDPLQNSPNTESYDEAMLHALHTVSGNKRGTSIGYAAQPDLIAYAICGLFDVSVTKDQEGVSQLKVHKMAPETFRFLLTHGLLTGPQVEKALRLDGRLDHRHTLSEASIVHALTQYDDTLQALIYYLSSAPLLSAHELSAALLVCLRAVQRLATSSTTKVIENDNTSVSKPLISGDTTMTNGISGDSEEAVAEAGFDGDWPDPDPQEGLTHNARSALGSCLTRLSLCHDKDVQRALRATMSTEEILILVDYIRMELSSGGWLARYLDADLQGETDLSTQTNQVNVAAKILNCAIDSLGASTWLLGSGSELDASRSAEKVTYMQAEINAALEGIENSAFLQHILHEVLLYAKSADEAGRLLSVPGIVAAPVGAEGKEAQMLPLGMKKEKITRTKIGSGGEEIPRSSRDRRQLESRKVPEYSFERITI